MEIAALERENATLKMALAHERKQHAAAKSQELIEARGNLEQDFGNWSVL
jgi:hypothetical protein